MSVLLVVLGACLLASCSLVQQLSPGHQESVRRAEALQDLNMRVMRFADEYAGRVKEAMNELQESAPGPEERLRAQNWKTQQIESAYTIASGPNPVSNALDMVVLAALSRLVMEDIWIAQQHAERARSAHEAHRILEEDAWQLVDGVLTQSQTAELREAIGRWRAENPSVSAVAYVRFPAFAKSVAAVGAEQTGSSGSLFSFLGLDPLAQLDPAVRELTQTRELAERAIFYMQRTPALIDMQLQRVAYEFAAAPESQSFLQDLHRISLVGSAADQLVGSLPDLIAREREALLSQLMSELDDRQGTLSSLSGDMRATLQAGTSTANSLQDMLETFDRVAARFPPAGGSSVRPEKSEPFDITEYTEMLRELSGTIRELDALAHNADAALPALRVTFAEASQGFERILDRVFVQLLVLVVVAIVTTWAGAIAYRAAVFRMQRTGQKARR